MNPGKRPPGLGGGGGVGCRGGGSVFSGLDHTAAGMGVPWNPQGPIKKNQIMGFSLLFNFLFWFISILWGSKETQIENKKTFF